MCWPVGTVVAGVVERAGSIVIAEGWNISVAMAPSWLRISL
jgi:hypothetical protein